jgi:quinol monooxygenase YgiN
MGEFRKAKIRKLAAPRAAAIAPRPPKRGVTLIVALRARPGQEAALEKELRALVAPTRAERGCIAYDLHVSSDVPGLFLLREIWASLKHHQKHWDTEHMKKWGQKKTALVETREASFWKRIA